MIADEREQTDVMEEVTSEPYVALEAKSLEIMGPGTQDLYRNEQLATWS